MKEENNLEIDYDRLSKIFNHSESQGRNDFSIKVNDSASSDTDTGRNQHDLSYLDSHVSENKVPLYVCLSALLGFVIIFFLILDNNGSHNNSDTDYSTTGTESSTQSDLGSSTDIGESANLGKETDLGDDDEKGDTIVRIEATYDGSTKAGTILNKSNDDIVVTAYYDDESTNEIDLSECRMKSAKLKPGKTSTAVIRYKGMKCKLSVKCTTITQKQYMQKCKAISYKKLSRNPKKYYGRKIKFKGKIVQVIEDDWYTRYIINITKGNFGIWNDTMYVEYEPSSSKRILEDDIVTFYGTYDGLYTYENLWGASKTVPSATAKYAIIH